jgi:hypothetical protein
VARSHALVRASACVSRGQEALLTLWLFFHCRSGFIHQEILPAESRKREKRRAPLLFSQSPRVAFDSAAAVLPQFFSLWSSSAAWCACVLSSERSLLFVLPAQIFLESLLLSPREILYIHSIVIFTIAAIRCRTEKHTRPQRANIIGCKIFQTRSESAESREKRRAPPVGRDTRSLLVISFYTNNIFKPKSCSNCDEH